VAGVWTSGKMLKPYQKARLTSFVNPDNDPKGSGYQTKQSLIAIGSGGVWGKGAAKAPRPRAIFSPFPTPTSSSPHLARSTASSARFSSCCYTFSY